MINGTEHGPADAMFIAIGGVPQADWIKGQSLRRDEAGYLLTGPDLSEHGRPPADWPLERAPYALEASVPGVFVAATFATDPPSASLPPSGRSDRSRTSPLRPG